MDPALRWDDGASSSLLGPALLQNASGFAAQQDAGSRGYNNASRMR